MHTAPGILWRRPAWALSVPHPFTPEEIRLWHDAKRKLEIEPDRAPPKPIAIYIQCQMPFGISGGVITGDVALCDVCNGN